MKKKDLDKIKERLEDSKRLESISMDIASIFKLFEYKWAFNDGDMNYTKLYIPSVEDIRKTLIDLIITTIKDNVRVSETGRLFVQQEEDGYISYGMRIELSEYFDIDVSNKKGRKNVY